MGRHQSLAHRAVKGGISVNKYTVALLFSYLLIGTGCSSIQSGPWDAKKMELSGIPYNLPRSDLKVKIRINEGAVKVVTNAEIVPDESATFYAHPDINLWVSSEHHITLTNGLLTTIDNIDDGQAGAVLNNLAHTAINIRKIAELQSDGDNPFESATALPTTEELEAILNTIEGKEFVVPADGRSREFPGSAGLVRVMSRVTSPGIPAPGRAPVVRPEFEDGVYSRLLKSVTVVTQLSINLVSLRAKREQEITKLINVQKEQLQNFDLEIKQATTNELRLCKRLQENGNALKELNNSLEQISVLETKAGTASLASHRQFIEGKKQSVAKKIAACSAEKKKKHDLIENRARRDLRKTQLESTRTEVRGLSLAKVSYSLQSHAERIMVVDTSRDYRISMRRGWIGKTTNQLKFENGILVDFNRSKPAEATVATDALVDTTKVLWDGMQEVLRVPQVVLGIEQENVAAEVELTEEQIRLLQKNLQAEQATAESAQIEAQIELLIKQAQLAAAKADPLAYAESLAEAKEEALPANQEVSEEVQPEPVAEEDSNESDDPGAVPNSDSGG